jgi:hypothetical protein
MATGCEPDERSAAFTGCSAVVGHTMSGMPCESDSDTELEESMSGIKRKKQAGLTLT